MTNKKEGARPLTAGRPVRLAEGEGLRLPQHESLRSLHGARDGYDDAFLGNAGVVEIGVVIAQVEVEAFE